MSPTSTKHTPCRQLPWLGPSFWHKPIYVIINIKWTTRPKTLPACSLPTQWVTKNTVFTSSQVQHLEVPSTSWRCHLQTFWRKVWQKMGKDDFLPLNASTSCKIHPKKFLRAFGKKDNYVALNMESWRAQSSSMSISNGKTHALVMPISTPCAHPPVEPARHGSEDEEEERSFGCMWLPSWLILNTDAGFHP